MDPLQVLRVAKNIVSQFPIKEFRYQPSVTHKLKVRLRCLMLDGWLVVKSATEPFRVMQYIYEAEKSTLSEARRKKLIDSFSLNSPDIETLEMPENGWMVECGSNYFCGCYYFNKWGNCIHLMAIQWELKLPFLGEDAYENTFTNVRRSRLQ